MTYKNWGADFIKRFRCFDWPTWFIFKLLFKVKSKKYICFTKTIVISNYLSTKLFEDNFIKETTNFKFNSFIYFLPYIKTSSVKQKKVLHFHQ